MGVVGCILGFLVVIYLCYKDWSVYIASIVGAAVVIAFNVLPFMDTLLDSYVNGMFVPIKSFFFLLLFGASQVANCAAGLACGLTGCLAFTTTFKLHGILQ